MRDISNGYARGDFIGEGYIQHFDLSPKPHFTLYILVNPDVYPYGSNVAKAYAQNQSLLGINWGIFPSSQLFPQFLPTPLITSLNPHNKFLFYIFFKT